VSTVEPVVTIGLAAALFGESLTPTQVAGATLVLVAALAVNTRPTVAPTPAAARSLAAATATPAATATRVAPPEVGAHERHGALAGVGQRG
jgi:drug/metabolite transporter (DMT)-like permease